MRGKLRDGDRGDGRVSGWGCHFVVISWSSGGIWLVHVRSVCMVFVRKESALEWVAVDGGVEALVRES